MRTPEEITRIVDHYFADPLATADVSATATAVTHDAAAVRLSVEATAMTIGITTAPRIDSQLSRCVESLLSAGATDVRLFAEPNCDLTGLPPVVTITERPQRLGAWHNWQTMCRELLDASTSPIILTVQDDTIFSRESLTTLLDLWPTQTNVGFLSLYTPSHYQRKYCVERAGRVLAIHADAESARRDARRTKHRGAHVVLREYPLGCYRIGTRSLWGACALAFPRAALAQVIDHRIARTWRGAGRASSRRRAPHEIANIDTAIGRIMNDIDLAMLFVNPSLAQHAAHHSTLGHGGLGGRRQSWRVAPDLLGLAPGTTTATTLSPPRPLPCCGG